MMLIKCNICHRETEQTGVKQKHYAYNLLLLNYRFYDLFPQKQVLLITYTPDIEITA